MRNFFKKAGQAIAMLFGKAFGFAKKSSSIAVNVTNIIKLIVENPTLELATELTKFTEVDDKILEFVKKIIPDVAKSVGLFHGFVNESDSPEESLQKLLDYLKQSTKGTRADFWIRLAAEFNLRLLPEIKEAYRDENISFSESLVLTQIAYGIFKEEQEKDKKEE